MSGFSRRAHWIVLVLATTVAILTTALLLAYSGAGRPLNQDEVESYIRRIESQPQEPGGRHDLPALRRFLEADDGRPFYVANLYTFRERADYASPQPESVTGPEAFERFTQVMLGLLARQASHPVFGSSWTEARPGGWDRLVIVRYRSRRDIAEIFASTAFAEAATHKWAAIERNERLVVQGRQIPELPIPGGLLASMSWIVVIVAGLSIWTRRGRRVRA